MDDDLVEAALLDGPPAASQDGVLWNGLKVPKNRPMPPLGATLERMSDSRPMPKKSRAEPEAHDQEGLAGIGTPAVPSAARVTLTRMPTSVLRLASPTPRATR